MHDAVIDPVSLLLNRDYHADDSRDRDHQGCSVTDVGTDHHDGPSSATSPDHRFRPDHRHPDRPGRPGHVYGPAAAHPRSCHYIYVGPYPLPDPHCTPGAVDPQVTQTDIGSTICSSGFTSTIRPPESVTEPEKEASAAAYGYSGSFHVAEYDHLIPLELGGDPNDPANLWIEPPDNPNATSFVNTKDQLERQAQ